MTATHRRALRLTAALLAALAFAALTVRPSPGQSASTGTVQMVQGGTGNGRVTSQPAGID